MENKKNKSSFFIFAGIIFCVIYIILAVKPLGTEYQFEPEWKIDVTNPTISQAEENEILLPFKLGQKMGYFTQSGKVTNFVTFPQKADISEYFYTFYNNNNTGTSFYTPDGNAAGKLSFSGFPMIDADRLFVFLPGGSSFLMADNSGSFKWEYGGTAPVTAFDSSENAVVAGFADGNICELNLDGSLLHRFTPGGSDIPVVLGTAVSKSGNYIATICGQNKQRFVLTQTNSTHPKIVFHEFLDSKKTYQCLIKFSSDDNYVYYNADKVFGIVETKTGKKAHLKLYGQAISIEENGNLIFILTKAGTKYTVYTVEKFNTMVGSFSFEAKNAFIKTNGSHLYVGKDSSISSLKITKK